MANFDSHRIPRSIPAPAGKPPPRLSLWAGCWVYPRACGETMVAVQGRPTPNGLSPRLRGNHGAVWVSNGEPGSIPAPAGKPLHSPQRVPVCRVYPRACGETIAMEKAQPPNKGLSPRLRGNPLPTLAVRGRLRSIPAPAGKPSTGRTPAAQSGVYPRACGETVASDTPACRAKGLSPRLRGNLGHSGATCDSNRSIPAPAGKPVITIPPQFLHKVYPRACGETTYTAERRDAAKGLSPRLRGNHI